MIIPMKRLLWHACYYLGLPVLARALNRNKLTVVLYHGVDKPRDLGTYNYRKKYITPGAFERHLRYYAAHHTVMALDDAVAALRNGTLPPRALAITFDDGYRNNYTHAFPLLKRYSMPATVFVTTNFVVNKEPLWVDRLEYAINAGMRNASYAEKVAYDERERARLKLLPHTERMRALEELERSCGVQLTDFGGNRAVYAPLTKADMEEMGVHGIMFGAHTESHPILRTLDAEGQRSEIANSNTALSLLTPTRSKVFAYPNGQVGDMDEATAAIVRKCGFDAALTTLPGVNDTATDPYMLKRFTLDGTDEFPFFVVTASGVRTIITSILHHEKRG